METPEAGAEEGYNGLDEWQVISEESRK